MKENKNILFVNSKNRGIMKSNKNAFTLIELLAIIVILAIIAVITVPIILNIIENSKKGAVIDSAYGYKDAVSKYYAIELIDNPDLRLDGSYTVSDGVLSGTGINNKSIPISGTAPSGGSLIYENNTLMSGCLNVDDYMVTFSNGEVSDTKKGVCPPVISSCPGCVFRRSGYMFYSGNERTTLSPTAYTDNYTNIITDSFLGVILDNENKIYRAFACGIKDEIPFCVEGTVDGSKYLSNKDLVNSSYLYDGACNEDNDYTYCIENNIETKVYKNGKVEVKVYGEKNSYNSTLVLENGQIDYAFATPMLPI